MKAATLQAKALNLALSLAIGALVGFAVSAVAKKFTEITQRIDTAVTKSKEAASAATDTTASVKELVDAYKELGDKSGWDSDDFEQAKDIQDQLLDLAKEQSSLDEDRAKMQTKTANISAMKNFITKLLNSQRHAINFDY